MFRFEYQWVLYLLVLVPVLLSLFLGTRVVERRRLKRLGNPELLADLMPNVSYVRPYVKFFLVLLALILMIFALARPQFGNKLRQDKRKGVEAMIVLDVSKSMLATDLSPNRLEYAKRVVSKLVDNLSHDKVGLIVFAGDAYVQLPITSDNVSAKMFLASINTDMVPRPGTSIGSALELAVHSFPQGESLSGKTIILMTDGENHEDDAVAASKYAKDNGIVVHVIGLGSAEGVPIPVSGSMSYKKDDDGQVVVSKLDEKLCADIAQAGQGVYVRANNSNQALRRVEQEIDKMQKGDITGQVYESYADHFYVLAWIALLVLILEFFILNRKNKKLNSIHLFDK